ncbi:MAG TPA: hypothetical protein VJ044_10830 [Candidatus Hodarchaeales archaeon]|uniref:Uncharacterized protein n=2 Tax=Candidatus Chisholmiibacteriota TaxID=1817900 RepID=A0A1G1VLJ8_9BACT|nr:MAG: hypothetical protein A2785_01540 [Candidatus Chisholmbacteria bacterium RIFCSPHIGHO2_01_FULL_49_18]OGY21772.1 MAG: hypothetical protein A3A65_02280 [Candidatus Chisholmbacteria bacterium RIFCSPLOWO2_01_FULL_49_14]HKZ41448.1 hypothetical protein [Candidatus Hodarchaeales archaeon]
MSPDIDKTGLGIESRESYLELPPPLLQDKKSVWVATKNERKLDAARGLFQRYPVLFGTEFLVPQPHELTGTEPDDKEAIQISRSKVENVVAQLEGRPGPKTLVMGSDIVVWFDGKPYQNLSRLETLTSNILWKEVNHLQDVFSGEVEVMWDVATSVSTCEVRATVADRHVAHFRPIPADAIYWAWEKDKDGFKKRNSRIQLLDDFQDYVIDIGTIPFNCIADREGEFLTQQEWVKARPVPEEMKRDYMQEVLTQVIGGLPVNGRLDNLLSVKPSAKCQRGWMLV